MIQLQEARERKKEILPNSPTETKGGTSRRRGITHREIQWALTIGDVLCLLIPLLIANFDSSKQHTGAFFLNRVITVGIAGFAWFVLETSADLRDVGRAASLWRTHRATLCAILVVLFAKGAYYNSSHTTLQNPPLGVISVTAFALWRTVFAILLKFAPITRRMLIIGAGVTGGLLANEVAERRASGNKDYEIVGFLDDNTEKVDLYHCGIKVLGTSADLMEVAQERNVDTIVLAVNRIPVISADVFSSLVSARESGLRVTSMPDLYETLTSKIAVEHLGHNWGIIFPIAGYQRPILHDILCRGMDILSGLLGCLITLLVCPFVIVCNRLWNRGPLFYFQKRVGRGGKTFRIYKFRSMVPNAESGKAVWATVNDSRITKFGNFLRKTRLDELPQFWNVLIGEMSLIGPRPERPEFVTTLGENIPFYRARHAIKPGLTGWAQVMYRYGSSQEDSLIKLQYDLYYIKHRSPMLDLRIVAKTIKVVLFAAGR